MQTEPSRHKLIEDQVISPILNDVVDTLRKAGIAYLFGGGLAPDCCGQAATAETRRRSRGCAADPNAQEPA